jgi:hypothetical protein
MKRIIDLIKESDPRRNPKNFTKVKILEPAGRKIAIVDVPKVGTLLRSLMEQHAGRKLQDIDLAHTAVSFWQYIEVCSLFDSSRDLTILKNWVKMIITVKELRS